MVPASEHGAVSPHLRKSISEHNSILATYVAAWLRKRGKALRPRLNDEQKAQLEECFELMDADGSGAIDADELGAAFKLLGIQANRTEISELLAEVDSDGSGEVEYPEFIQIMTSTLAKLAQKKEEEGASSNQVPFSLLATAYRRKRIMEGLTSGNKDMTIQVMQIAEEAARKAAEEAAQNCPDDRSACSSSNGSSCGAPAAGSTGLQAPPRLRKVLTKMKSVKLAGTDADLNSSSSFSGNGSVASFISTVSAEPQAARLLGDLLRQHVQHKALDNMVDHQQEQQTCSTDSVTAVNADKQVVFNTHMTSRLQRVQLTQEIEVPKYVLSHRTSAASNPGSPSGRQQNCRSPPRGQGRTRASSLILPGSLTQASNRLGLDLSTCQHTQETPEQAQVSGVQDAWPSAVMVHQQQQEVLSPALNLRSSSGGSCGARNGRLQGLGHRRSKSYSNLAS